MSDRLADVEARIHTVQQLSVVITAMRGIAAARVREASESLEAVRAFAATIAATIGEALAFLPAGEEPAAAPPRSESHTIVALLTEQGFVGTFNEHVLDAVAATRRQPGPGVTRLFLAGSRGQTAAAGRNLAPEWTTAMISHPADAPALADRLAGALFGGERGPGRVTLIHGTPDHNGVRIVVRDLLPFDFGRFPPAHPALPPRTSLAPRALMAALAEEYVFAELTEATVLSFAAENEARMRAMVAARSNVSATFDTLTARARQVRQEEITTELGELAAGVLSAQP